MNKTFLRHATVLLLAGLAAASTAQAAMVEYSVTALGGDVWRYDYTLHNTGPALSFDEFTVYFDAPGITGLTGLAAPAGWSPLAVQPDPLLPDAGYFDALHVAGTLPAGDVVSGFSVAFSYLAGLTPGAQRFDLVLSDPFETVASGATVAAPSAVPLPVPAALMLMGLGVGAVGARRRRTELAA